MDNRDRQNEIIALLRGMTETNEAARLFKELFNIRLEKYKDELVKMDSPNHRGKAQELNELIAKIFSVRA